MPNVKLYKAKVDDQSEFLTQPNDKEILICLECPLPKCDRFYCKRYEEERKKLKGVKNDK